MQACKCQPRNRPRGSLRDFRPAKVLPGGESRLGACSSLLEHGQNGLLAGPEKDLQWRRDEGTLMRQLTTRSSWLEST